MKIALNRAEGELREKTRSLIGELRVSDQDMNRIISNLPRNSALIEFKRFNLADFKKGEPVSQNWAAYLLLSDIAAEQQVLFEDLGSMEDVNKALDGSEDPTSTLHTVFFGKFEKYLKNVDTLYIAPDGFLNQLSFASLKTGDGKYLCQKYKLKQLQTGRDLSAAPPQKTANTLIAIGGIDYFQMPGKASGKNIPDDLMKAMATLNPNLRAAEEMKEGIGYLPHSLYEVECIEKLFKKHYTDGQSIIYEKERAGETLLKTMPSVPRILHLSTHGFYLQKVEDSPLAETEPMALSGLALAGANLGLKGILDENGDDGLLYSLEVLSLNLQGTELVSLSACDTGKGVIDYSEGVYGLVRAFRTAGAKNVLMTLSKVGDEASKEFMVKFYEIWLTSPEGTSPADAMHETRRYFIHHENPAFRDPKFWSPYVLVGT